MVYTKEQKLKIVKEYLNGIVEYPENSTKQQRENIRKKIKQWVGIYKEHGPDGLKPKRHEFTFEDKKCAIEMLLNGESIYQVSFKYGVDRKTIRRWWQRYDECGYVGLDSKNKSKYFKVQTKNKRKLSVLEEENIKLKKKYYKLQAENDYLKKLQALALKKGQQMKKNF